MLDEWFFLYIPRLFCALSFLIKPIFVYLIFSGKSANFGNYRFLLLSFAVFNLIYSVVNVLVPLVSKRKSTSTAIVIVVSSSSDMGRFLKFPSSTSTCWSVAALVSASYAIILLHFVYRYLVIQRSSLTDRNFHWYMTISAFVLIMYFLTWYAICYFPGRANVEIREYIRKDHLEIYGDDSMNSYMIGTLFRGGSWETMFRSWATLIMVTSVSVASIFSFSIMAKKIMSKLKKMTVNASKKTVKIQFELLRALIVQTVIPIFISFSPCLLCWYSPVFGIQLPRGFNYLELSALGLFAFVDPVAILLCLPIFRKRIVCFSCHNLSFAVSVEEIKVVSETRI